MVGDVFDAAAVTAFRPALVLHQLTDLHGRRRMLLIGLAVFMLGSVGAALAAPEG